MRRVLAVVLVATIPGCSQNSSPEQAFVDARAAIESRNRLAFEAVVDVNAVCEQCIDALLEQLGSANLESSSGSGFEALGSMLGMQLAEAYRPNLVSRCQSEVATAVENGELLSLHTGDLLFRLGEFSQFEDKALRKVSIATPTDTASFALRLEKHDRWRIVGLDGLSAAIGELTQRAAAEAMALAEAAKEAEREQYRGELEAAESHVTKLQAAKWFSSFNLETGTVEMFDYDLSEQSFASMERIARSLSIFFGSRNGSYRVRIYGTDGRLWYSYTPDFGLQTYYLAPRWD